MAIKKNPDGKTATVTTGGDRPGRTAGVIAPRKNPLAVPYPKSDPLRAKPVRVKAKGR